MFVNIFQKVLELQVGHWYLQVGQGVTRGSVVRHPWVRLQFRWASDKSVHLWSCRSTQSLIPSRVKPTTLKLVFTAFLLDA